MKSPLIRVSTVVTIAAVAGCASPETWRYEARSTPVTDAPLDRRVAVLPFQDTRGPVNSDGSLAFLLPVVPAGLAKHDRVETGSGFVSHTGYRVDPSVDLSRALADEIDRSNLFRDVEFTDEVSFLEAKRGLGFDFYLTGTVSDMTYHGGVISYSASVVGPVLWVFGMPSSYSRNSLAVKLVLRRVHDDAVIWHGSRYYASRSHVRGLYYDSGGEFSDYPKMMAEACAQWIDELHLASRRSPGQFERY